MARFAGDRELKVARMHCAGDDANIGVRRCHHCTLLDMRLQPARPPRGEGVSGPAWLIACSACATLMSSVIASALQNHVAGEHPGAPS